MAKPIVLKITGDTQGLRQAVSETDGILGRLKPSAAQAGAALAGGLAVGAAAIFSIGQAADEMRQNIIKGTGASGEALDDLFDSAKDVLSSVPDSSAVVSNALADVNTFFGTTGDELENTTELFLDFARLTDVDVGSAISNLDAALTQFGSNDSIDEALGDLTRIAQATGVPMEKLLGQMKTFGPIFANANFSLEETEAIIGQLTMAGVDLTRVGPALNKFFRDTAAAGEDPQEALASIVDQIANAEDATAALNLATSAFGAEGAQRMTSAIRSGNFDLEDFNGLLGEGAGLVGEQTEATASFSDKWNELKNKVFVQLMPVATRLFDLIIDGMDAIGPAVQRMVAWYQEELAPKVEAAMEDIREVIQTVIAVVTEIWETWGEDIMRVVTVVWDIIKTRIENTFQVIKGIWDTFVGVFTGDWQRAWDGIKGIVSGFASEVINTITSLPRLLLAVIPAMRRAGLSIFTALMNGAKNALTSAVGFAADLVSGLWNAFKNLFNRNVVDRINRAIPDKINLPGPIPDINLPDNPIPRLAMGGTMSREGVALVGERGPELVRLPRGASVEPNHSGAANFAGSVTVNAQTNADAWDIAREVAWVFATRGG